MSKDQRSILASLHHNSTTRSVVGHFTVTVSVEVDMHSWFLLLCFVVLVNVTSWGIPPNIHEGSIWAGVELITHGRNTKRRQTGWVYCENKQDILTEPAYKVL